MSIDIKGVSKHFNGFKALKNVDLKVEAGELVALLGPSGSGKTTLLRIIAGLETADSGGIYFHGENAKATMAKDRHVGFVFQHFALFRHMTVFENVAFGLRVKPKAIRLPEEAIRKKVSELLKLVQLEWVGSRFPSQLSGGQRQRIALARALAVEPKVLLLDEPFGSLDARVRKELRQWLRRFHDELHITSLFVTHDQEEALEVADRIVVMNEGIVEQVGTPNEVYHHPANAFVLNFLGNVNLFHCRVEDGKTILGNTALNLPQENPAAKKVSVYVRPHQFKVSRDPCGAGSFKGKLAYINAAGTVVKLELIAEWGDVIQVEMTHDDFQALKPVKSETYFVCPIRVALSEYSI